MWDLVKMQILILPFKKKKKDANSDSAGLGQTRDSAFLAGSLGLLTLLVGGQT